MTNPTRVATLLLALFVLPVAAADFSIPVEGAQALQLDVPDAWRGTNLQDGPATTAVFSGTGDFRLMLTALDPTKTHAIDQGQDGLRESVAAAAADAQQQAAEDALAVQDLQGAHVHGAWFSATDEAATLPAGEYRYMTQGVLSVAGTLTTFTLLVNADDNAAAGRIRDEALAALRTLRPQD